MHGLAAAQAIQNPSCGHGCPCSRSNRSRVISRFGSSRLQAYMENIWIPGSKGSVLERLRNGTTCNNDDKSHNWAGGTAADDSVLVHCFLCQVNHCMPCPLRSANGPAQRAEDASPGIAESPQRTHGGAKGPTQDG